VSKQKTPRICGATRRIMLACEWHIKVNYGDELLNCPQNFLSFDRLQAWIHACGGVLCMCVFAIF
jgi:hypothetical protein